MEKSIENNIKSTNATIICINNSENKFLIQVLKNQLVLDKANESIANGASKIKILIITYLNEYENIKFNNDIVRVPFIRPSTENMLIELVSIDIFEFIVVINSEKQIFFPK